MEEMDYANEISLESLPFELWLYVFRFVDIDTICLRLPYVCKDFNELVCSNSIWEPIVKSRFPRATYNLKQQEQSFKDLFRSIYALSIEKFNIYIIAIDGSDIFSTDNLSHPIPLALELQSHLCDLETSGATITGHGSAPWGTFFAFGVSFGNYFALNHMVSYEAYPAVFTNYVAEMNLSQNSMKGVFKSTWHEVTGSFFGFESEEESEELFSTPEPLTTLYNKSKTAASQAPTLLGKWEISFQSDKKKRNSNERAMEFLVSLELKDRTDNGLEGSISQTSMPSPRPTPSIARGNVYNGIISLNFYVADKITTTCLLEPTLVVGGAAMELRGVASVLNFQTTNKQISMGKITMKRAKIQ